MREIPARRIGSFRDKKGSRMNFKALYLLEFRQRMLRRLFYKIHSLHGIDDSARGAGKGCQGVANTAQRQPAMPTIIGAVANLSAALATLRLTPPARRRSGRSA
jgi:hypothetical protein